MLVDSHCHLDFPDFERELDTIVARAKRAGVGTMLTICTHVSRFDQVLAVAERFPDIYCTVGIHPHESANEPEVTTRQLLLLAKHPKVIGFGETGLDYFYEHSPRESQVRSFRTHIAAARAAGLPLVVHTRDAEDDTARILAEEFEKGPFGGVLHCFSSSRTLAGRAIDLGLFVSFSGMVTFKNADDLRVTAAALPIDHLLVETDAPFLAPVPKRGERNEPAFVGLTAARVAALKHMSAEAFATATTNNFFRLFSKAKRPA